MSTPTAQDLMTDRVLAAKADWSLEKLATFFTEHSISGAPVVSDYGGAIGVVSLSDLARHGSQAGADTNGDEDTPPAYYRGDALTLHEDEKLKSLRGASETTVRDIMMPAVFTVEEGASIREVADRMVRGRLHRLLVVKTGTKREIVGIISSLDLLDWIRDPNR